MRLDAVGQTVISIFAKNSSALSEDKIYGLSSDENSRPILNDGEWHALAVVEDGRGALSAFVDNKWYRLRHILPAAGVEEDRHDEGAQFSLRTLRFAANAEASETPMVLRLGREGRRELGGVLNGNATARRAGFKVVKFFRNIVTTKILVARDVFATYVSAHCHRWRFWTAAAAMVDLRRTMAPR